MAVKRKSKRDGRLKRAGVKGFNKPKRTPSHRKKSHIVVAKSGKKIKTIRFGQQGAKTAGKRKAGESSKMKKKRASFKARHGRNIKKGKMVMKDFLKKVWNIIKGEDKNWDGNVDIRDKMIAAKQKVKITTDNIG